MTLVLMRPRFDTSVRLPDSHLHIGAASYVSLLCDASHTRKQPRAANPTSEAKIHLDLSVLVTRRDTRPSLDK